MGVSATEVPVSWSAEKLSQQQLVSPVHTAPVSARFGCGMAQLQLGTVESAERSRSFVGCAVAFAACVVAAAGFAAVAVAVARCIVGSRRSAAHVEWHPGSLARCRYRPSQALARCVAAAVGFAVVRARCALVAVGEQGVAVQSVGAFACKELLMARMHA